MLQNFKTKIALFFAKLLPRAIYEQYKINFDSTQNFSQTYFSQEGEEIIVRRYFEYRNSGFFIDVGAYHPIKFSNTYKLYTLGWRGVNIDATPNSMIAFNEARANDLNIEAAISNEIEDLKFFEFDEGALNTFDELKAQKIINAGIYKLISTRQIRTQTLESILDKCIKAGQKIDLLSIDAEGFDLKVLKSNNWEKFRPSLIIIETDIKDIARFLRSAEANYLQEKGYSCFAKTFKSAFFCETQPHL